MSARTTCFVLGSICCLAFPWSQAPGQVATDGTVGPRLGLAGPDYAIGAELGSRAGGNLFHSFERFSIGTGESANFSGPDDVENVISRVTGGTRSDIDGPLRSTIPGADFFFVNPAGVVFGPNASLDVQGSFHVSTADELRFSDGAVFSATNPDASSLTVAAPEAFGFLGTAPAAITVDRSTLGVNEGETFSIVGGDIAIDGGNQGLASGGEDGTVRAPAGEINLLALRAPGEARFSDGEVRADEAADVRLTDQALVTVSGDGGGTVRIQAGALVVDGQSSILANNSGDANADGGINILAERTTLSDGSTIRADALNAGAGGHVNVVAGELEIRSGSFFGSDTYGGGQGGRVTVDADRILISGDGAEGFTGLGTDVLSGSGQGGETVVRARDLQILEGGLISSSTVADGDAGAVTVEADHLLIDGQGLPTGIISEASPFTSTGQVLASDGDAGTVLVEAGDLELRDAGTISSTTRSLGNAGTVAVEADHLLIDGQGFPTGIISEATPLFSSTGQVLASAGDAGTVLVKAGHLELRDAGTISSATFTMGSAGTVTVDARNLLIGEGGSSRFVTGISSDAGAFVTRDGQTLAVAQGNAGAVTVRADQLTILGGAQIRSFTFGEGNAGKVMVEAERLWIASDGSQNLAGIASNAVKGSTGHAGQVEVTAGELLIVGGGAQIGSVTFGEGNAGKVKVEAERLVIAGDGSETLAGITSNADESSTGHAGQVEVTAGKLLIAGGGAQIASLTFGEGNAGKVMVEAERLVIAGDGSETFAGITSNADESSTGHAGQVEVTAGELLIAGGGAQIASLTFGEGNAGNVMVEAEVLEIVGDASQTPAGITANADEGSTGHAGQVEVTAGELIIVGGGAQIASVTFGEGNAGKVVVEAERLVIASDGSQTLAGITSNADEGSTGHAGQVEVTAGELLIAGGGAQIASLTFGEGNAGNVMVEAEVLEIVGDASQKLAGILSSAEAGSIGDAGVVLVIADRLSLAGQGAEIGTAARIGTIGDAGSVNISAAIVALRDLASIQSSNQGNGSAGDITVAATESLVIDGAEITTESAKGGGGITLQVGDLIDLADGRITTSISGDVAGDRAGNIAIDPTFLILDSSSIIARANAGDGGNITIQADNILRSPDSVIDASSRTGISGAVAISSPEVDLTGGLVVLNVPLLDAASLLRERCDARRDVGASSFTGVGRGGLPPGPDQPLMSDYATGVAPRDRAERPGDVEPEIARVDAPARRDQLALVTQPCAGAL